MFRFQDIYGWYTDNIDDGSVFRVDKTVQCWQLYRRSDWKKYEDKLQKQFLLDKVKTIRRIRHIGEELYPMGIYVITDYRPNWLQFVYPMQKYRPNGSPYSAVFADHYSLPYYPKQTKQIQFHQTQYIPGGMTGENGVVAHTKNHFKDETPFADIPFVASLNEYKESILSIFRHDWDEAQDGGGKRKRAAPAADASKRSRRTLDAETVCAKWLANKVQHVMIFVKRHNATYDCTCIVYDEKRRSQDESELGCAFSLQQPPTEAVLRERVLEYLSQA
jgi:hypothetical protein